jgi:hypothetical protein
MSCRRRTISPHRRGYVLLMVLLLLSVSATIVGALCRQAMLSQSAAVRAQEELQLHWGQVSCQTSLLPAADNIMDRARLAGAPPSSVVWESITLGGQPIQLGFGDEQARVNLNSVYAAGGKDAIRQALQSLGRTGLAVPRLILGPEPGGQRTPMFAFLPSASGESSDADRSDAGEMSAIIPVIGSLGQLFPDASPAELPGVDVTCWGDGKINLHRASAAVIAQAAGSLLSPVQVKKILSARSSQIDIPLQNLAAVAGVDDADRFMQKFCDDSFCHSLWIVTQIGQHKTYRLAVRDASDSQNIHSAILDW